MQSEIRILHIVEMKDYQVTLQSRTFRYRLPMICVEGRAGLSGAEAHRLRQHSGSELWSLKLESVSAYD